MIHKSPRNLLVDAIKRYGRDRVANEIAELTFMKPIADIGDGDRSQLVSLTPFQAQILLVMLMIGADELLEYLQNAA